MSRVAIVEDGYVNEVQVIANQECVDRRSRCIDVNMSVNGVDLGEGLHRCLLGV